MVAVQQGGRCIATHHGLEFPGQVVAVLHPGVGATRPKWRYLVRCIANEHHAAMAHLVHTAAGKLVNRYPLQFKLHMRAQHGLNAGNHFLRLLFFRRVCIPAQLKVDAPHVVALLVQQHALAAVKRGVKPEPALRGEVRFLHHHVGNQKAVLKEVPGKVGTRHAPGVAVGTVGGNQPGSFHFKNAIRCFDGQSSVVTVLLQAGQLVLPAQVHQGRGCAGCDQLFLQVVLLQVDHGRHLVSGLGQQVELVGQAVAKEDLTHFPLNAPVCKTLAHAQPVPYFEGALGVAHGTRADAHRVVVIQHHDGLPAAGAVQRQCQPDRAGTDDDNRLTFHFAAQLLRALPVGEFRVGVGALHALNPV